MTALHPQVAPVGTLVGRFRDASGTVSKSKSLVFTGLGTVGRLFRVCVCILPGSVNPAPWLILCLDELSGQLQEPTFDLALMVFRHVSDILADAKTSVITSWNRQETEFRCFLFQFPI